MGENPFGFDLWVDNFHCAAVHRCACVWERREEVRVGDGVLAGSYNEVGRAVAALLFSELFAKRLNSPEIPAVNHHSSHSQLSAESGVLGSPFTRSASEHPLGSGLSLIFICVLHSSTVSLRSWRGPAAPAACRPDSIWHWFIWKLRPLSRF